ncbi:UvrB/UvrC motif-containing protein [Fontivita pretiosa]|jgi:protein arginine kinase activator|uniref:UvrB/UvrC motif-containing protein n=1 Tax=Fontivita pretiosa TaxID=2989684 RepID=UPI003D162BC5
MKCDNCKNQATVHLTEIRNGKKYEKHLCEQCAAQMEGLPVKSHTPINELLTNFVLAHSGQLVREQTQACEVCGITWAEFRQNGLLGCEHDYVLFEKELTPLLQRAHEGATHHLGKVPTRRGGSAAVPAKRQIDVARLRRELQRAVEAEDYERAAKLRDQIREAEG